MSENISEEKRKKEIIEKLTTLLANEKASLIARPLFKARDDGTFSVVVAVSLELTKDK